MTTFTVTHTHPDGRVVDVTAYQPAPGAPWPKPKRAATWAEIHLRYLEWDGSDDTPWLMEDLTPRIPRITCHCLGDWLADLKKHPVPWSDPFAWSVEAHNRVNARRRQAGKTAPLDMTVAEARAHWTAVLTQGR
jgi:hypothetical protein